MNSWLCKLWKPLAFLLGAVTDVAVQSFQQMSDFGIAAFGDLVAAVDDALEGTFGSGSGTSWLLLGAAAFAAWYLLSDDEKKSSLEVTGAQDKVVTQ